MGRLGAAGPARVGEGALLGLAQALALRGTRVAVPSRRWVLVTALAAGLAWSIGMLPSTLSDTGTTIDVSRPATWVLLGAGAMTLLLSIPTAQWTVLRDVLEGAWRWIPLNALAWMLGLAFTLLPSPFVDESTAAGVTATLFATGGVAMALTVAVVTGLGLRRLVRVGAGPSGSG